MAEVVDVVRIFISSKQAEFQEERAEISRRIRSFPLLAAVLSEDWSPERRGIKEKFLDEVRKSPIYIGLFGRYYSAATVLEYYTAIENTRREILIYLKRSAVVEPELADFSRILADPDRGHTLAYFNSWAELQPVFERHIWDAVRRMIEHYLELAGTAPLARGGGSVMQRRWMESKLSLTGLGLPGVDTAAGPGEWARRLQEMLPTVS